MPYVFLRPGNTCLGRQNIGRKFTGLALYPCTPHHDLPGTVDQTRGTQAADAFSVDIALGTTMTEEDLLNGFMNVTVKVEVVCPAEFIVVNFQQQMAKSG